MTSQPVERPVLFADADVHGVVRGLSLHGSAQALLFPSSKQLALYPEFATVLLELRTELAVSSAAAALAIDRNFIWIAMLLHGDKRLTPARVGMFTLPPHLTLSFDMLPDIGQQVRSLLAEPREHDPLLRVLEFALPGQRHNRLHFPLFRDSSIKSLQSVVRLMLSLCLGLHPACKRRPTLSARTKLMYLFWNVLNSSNRADLHVFCTTFVSVGKLAVIEYFLHFLLTNHPVETSLIFVPDTDQRRNVVAAISFHMDQFRQGGFADENFDMAHVNQLAGVVVEKCTRLWKGRLACSLTPRKFGSGSFHTQTSALERLSPSQLQETCAEALRVPAVAHPLYLASVHSTSISRARAVYNIQNLVSFAPLPRNIAREQLHAVRQNLLTHGPAMINTLHISICLMCTAKKQHQHLDRKMRVSRCGAVYCSECNVTDTVAHISALGRFIFVHDVCYYFCWQTMQIREWTGHINKQDAPSLPANTTTQTARKCLLCERRSGVETFRNLLDDRLGILMNVNLCSWHTPISSHKSLVYNYDSLLQAIQHKQTLCRTRRTKARGGSTS